MSKKRKQYSAAFKFKVAFEAAKGLKTRSEIAAAFDIHPMQVSQWKKQLIDDGSDLFARKNKQKKSSDSPNEEQLYEQIGRLKMELEWLKKKSIQLNID